VERTLIDHLALLNPSGRMSRRSYWMWSVAVLVFLATVPSAIVDAGMRLLALPLYLLGFWLLICLMAKRCHDIGRSGWWLLLLVVPLLGVLWVFAVLGFRRGERGDNQYGSDPHRAAPDYLTVKAVA
jgi:uncharacterized membrane protein YhaH (DUF805 family)